MFIKHLCNLVPKSHFKGLLSEATSGINYTLPVRFPAEKRGTLRRGVIEGSFVRGEGKENQ